MSSSSLTLDAFAKLGLAERVAHVLTVLEADACFLLSEKSAPDVFAEAVVDCLSMIGTFAGGAFLKTDYGSQIFFEPDVRMMQREESAAAAWIKYAAHFVSNRAHDVDGLPVITYSRSKHQSLEKLLPSLLSPDTLRRSRERPDAFYHYKNF